MSADKMNEGKGPVAEYFERVWSQALMAVSTAEDEVSKVVHRVSEVAGHSQEEVRRQVREFSDRLNDQRRDVEHHIEDRVRRTLSLMRLPRREELNDIAARLDRIAQRLDSLQNKQQK